MVALSFSLGDLPCDSSAFRQWFCCFFVQPENCKHSIGYQHRIFIGSRPTLSEKTQSAAHNRRNKIAYRKYGRHKQEPPNGRRGRNKTRNLRDSNGSRLR